VSADLVAHLREPFNAGYVQEAGASQPVDRDEEMTDPTGGRE